MLRACFGGVAIRSPILEEAYESFVQLIVASTPQVISSGYAKLLLFGGVALLIGSRRRLN